MTLYIRFPLSLRNVNTQNHFYALEALRNGGAAAQRAKFQSLALRGFRFGNALAEITHRDFKRRTTLMRDGDAWVVVGRKFYCTGAFYAHWIPTPVVDPESVKHLVFIPREVAGVSITDDWDGFGQRLTGSGSVAFDQLPRSLRKIRPR